MDRQIFHAPKAICLKRRRPSLVFLAVFLLFSAAFAQKPSPTAARASDTATAKEESDYQDLQRARHLLMMKNDIKAIEDAELRCFARAAIIRFIYEHEVLAEYDSAESMTIDFFEDGGSGNMLLPLLRQKAPEFAKKVEKKYMAKADMAVADLLELDGGSNTQEIANRTIARILRGDVSDYVLSIHDKLRPVDPRSADRILDALLAYWEKVPNIGKYGAFIDFIGGNYTRESAPIQLKTRYCRFVVNLGRGQIGETDSGPTARFILRTLKGVLPVIKESLPEFFNEAQSIYIVLETRLNKDKREQEEILARIEASEDKLQQTIDEAEATNDKKLKDWLWWRAATLALEKKKFKLAVDLAMKGTVDLADIALGRDQFLVNDALPAILKVKDLELADRVLKLIGDDMFSVRALLMTAKALGEAKENDRAFEKLTAILKLVEKGDADADKARYVLDALPIALNIERSTGFDVAGRAMNLINHLPTPSAEEKIGTPARAAYVNKTLLPTSYSILATFKLLAAADVAFAASTADDIKSKNYRLTAEIVVETERKYPMPPKERPREIVALLNDARLAAPELAVDTFLKVVESKKVTDPVWRREILEEALRMTDDVKYPIRRKSTYVVLNGVVDTVAGYMTYAYDQNLDALSLKGRIARDWLTQDKGRARQIVFQINGDLGLKPLTCEDAMVYEPTELYASVGAVANEVFSPKEIGEGVRGLFVLPWIENMQSPSQIAPLMELLSILQSPPAERQMLVDALERGMGKGFNDDRAFTQVITREGYRIGRLIYASPDRADLSTAFRELVKKNGGGPRCIESKPNTKDELPRQLSDLNKLLPEELRFSATDFESAEYRGSIKDRLYVNGETYKKISDLYKPTREKKNLPENKNDKAVQLEWRLKVTDVLEALDSWKASADETEAEVFNQKAVFYNGMIREATDPELKKIAMRAFMRCLDRSPMQKESFIEWLFYTRRFADDNSFVFNELVSEFPNPNFRVMVAAKKLGL